MKRILSIVCMMLAAEPVMAAGHFADQPESGRVEIIAYGNEAPSRTTYPLAGHSKYRIAKPGVVECMNRTFVLEAKLAAGNQQRSEERMREIMSRGRCSLANVDDKDFIVERFESYDAPIGRADLALARVSFTADEAGGTPLTVHFYIDRNDIVPARR